MKYAVQARWIVPVDRPPIADGIVSVADGRIVTIGENFSGRPPIDLGDVAVLPAFVNAHTHLEFSLLEKPLGTPEMPFTDWIGEVVGWRHRLAAQFAVDVAGLAAYRRSAIAAGLAESRRAGVAAIGEIAMAGCPLDAYGVEAGVSVVALLELLGRAEHQVGPLLDRAAAHVESLRRGGSVRPGLCPHATYSVHPELLRRACALSAAEDIPVAIHVAESLQELALLESHSGTLVDLLVQLKAWYPVELPRGMRPLDYLESLQNAHRSLVIHGNYLAADEIDFLASRRERMSVVFCPRTHAYFGHEPYPLLDMLRAGVRVAVGTDSRASNPDLSILAELRHVAQRRPRPDLAEILKMGTQSAAEALGIESDYGSIAVGKRAQFVAVPIFERRKDPVEQVLRDEVPGFPWPL
jgi:aminodeoxyfutalosine deaminase